MYQEDYNRADLQWLIDESGIEVVKFTDEDPNKTKVYIAAPFFNADQINVVEQIKFVLSQWGIEYYSPKDELLCKPDSSKQEREKAFSSNLEAIEKSDYVIAVTDGKDMGTIFECGYAYSRDVPIVYVALTLGENPFNLMLAESGHRVCTTMQQLEQLVRAIRNKKFIDERYDGKIE